MEVRKQRIAMTGLTIRVWMRDHLVILVTIVTKQKRGPTQLGWIQALAAVQVKAYTVFNNEGIFDLPYI
jgi:hypothetical protein